jgi:hypothetical protein
VAIRTVPEGLRSWPRKSPLEGQHLVFKTGRGLGCRLAGRSRHIAVAEALEQPSPDLFLDRT